MTNGTSVFDKIAETNKKATSSRSRLLVALLAFIFPFGAHNYYLGYHIKGIVQTFTLIALGIFIPPGITVFLLPIYIAWITSEGLIYLLWYDVKDGNDFLLYDKYNPPKPNKKTALFLAFLLPFGLHNIYQGKFKIGIAEWGFAAIIITINLYWLVIPILYISLNAILLVVVISWAEGIWMLIKK